MMPSITMRCDSMALVEIDGLKRHYEMASGTVKALDGIHLKIEEGERILLLGHLVQARQLA